jgi:excinuclease ABC subunit B
MQFKLVSGFKPAGDQPQAIDALVKSLKTGSRHQTLLGVTGSGKTFTLANVIQAVQKPTLVISHNKTLAAQLYQEFRDFFPHNAVSYFVSYYDYYQPESYIPSTDTYIEKETDINDEIDKLRLSATANLLSRPDVIVVASVSCIYNLGSPVEYGKNFIELIDGQLIDRQVLISRFVDIQYTRSDFELRRGSFRVKGDVIQIWPADLDYALKMDLLDDQIKLISPIDPISGEVRKTNSSSTDVRTPIVPRVPRYVIYPAKHYMANTQNQAEILDKIKYDLALRLHELKRQGKIMEAYRLGQRVKYDLEMIAELGYVNGIENYSRYFDGRQPGDPPFSLLDYFHYNSNKFPAVHRSPPTAHSKFLTIIDESHMTVPQLNGMYAGDRSRKQTLIDYGFRLPSALDNRPLKFAEIMDRLPQIIYSSATPSEWEMGLSGNHLAEQLIRPTGLIDPEIEIRPIMDQIPDLIREILVRVVKHERVLVTTLTKRTAEALTEYLNDQNQIKSVYASNPTIRSSDYPIIFPKVQYLHADVATLDRSDILDNLRSGEFDVVVGINLLREGLDLPEVSLVAILEADKEGFLRSKTSLIQTMGRAARHKNGKVIMYADTLTGSMKTAIQEVTRRRQIQVNYNRQHLITPQSIQKPIREKLLERVIETPRSQPIPKAFKDHGWSTIKDINSDSLTPKDRQQLIKVLTKLMNQAAKDWDFEIAAQYRDSLKTLKK